MWPAVKYVNIINDLKVMICLVRQCEKPFIVIILNRTFIDGISGEFGQAMVRILARRSRAKIPIARLNEPDMAPKRTKIV